MVTTNTDRHTRGATVLTRADVAKRLNVSEATVDRLIKSGDLEAMRHRNGKNIGIPEASLDDYIARQWEPVTPEEATAAA
jgi:excisionase family DNA binding protein